MKTTILDIIFSARVIIGPLVEYSYARLIVPILRARRKNNNNLLYKTWRSHSTPFDQYSILRNFFTIKAFECDFEKDGSNFYTSLNFRRKSQQLPFYRHDKTKQNKTKQKET